MGFRLNPYDRCVANKMINGKQCTMVWYVDDNKLSHEDPKVVDEIIAEVEKYFGEMTKTRGNKHSFFGMNFEITNDRIIEINMKQHVDDIIESFGEEIEETVASPATLRLFEVDETVPLLSTTKAEKFHSITAKLLY